MAKRWTEKLAKKELESAKRWARNIRFEGEEVPHLILLLGNTQEGPEIAAIPIPEAVISGGGPSISNFSRFLIAQAKPSYLILLLEAWMVQYRPGTSQEEAQGVPPSEHPDRVETIIALLSSPNFEIMSSSPIINGIPQDWQEYSGFEGRFSQMYGIEWGEA